MPIKVEFPDGTFREMPSRKREIKSREIHGGQSIYIDEPVFDPDWRFETAIGGKWWAFPRT